MEVEYSPLEASLSDPRRSERFTGWLVKVRKRHPDIYLVESRLPETRDMPGGPIYLIFRPLTHAEFENFSQSASSGDVTDEVVRAALLWPRTSKWSENPVRRILPGTFESLASLVVDLSGFQDPKAYKEGMQYGIDQSMTISSAVEIFICKAFPSYTPRDVADMDMMQQVTLLGQAQHILGIDFPMKEFFKPPKPPRDASKIDWDRLPTLTAGQIELERSTAHQRIHAKKIQEQKTERAIAAKAEKQATIAAVRERALARRKR